MDNPLLDFIYKSEFQMTEYINQECLPIGENINTHDLLILCGKIFGHYENDKIQLVVNKKKYPTPIVNILKE
jgi:hypothetical protein